MSYTLIRICAECGSRFRKEMRPGDPWPERCEQCPTKTTSAEQSRKRASTAAARHTGITTQQGTVIVDGAVAPT